MDYNIGEDVVTGARRRELQIKSVTSQDFSRKWRVTLSSYIVKL